MCIIPRVFWLPLALCLLIAPVGFAYERRIGSPPEVPPVPTPRDRDVPLALRYKSIDLRHFLYLESVRILPSGKWLVAVLVDFEEDEEFEESRSIWGFVALNLQTGKARFLDPGGRIEFGVTSAFRPLGNEACIVRWRDWPKSGATAPAVINAHAWNLRTGEIISRGPYRPTASLECALQGTTINVVVPDRSVENWEGSVSLKDGDVPIGSLSIWERPPTSGSARVSPDEILCGRERPYFRCNDLLIECSQSVKSAYVVRAHRIANPMQVVWSLDAAAVGAKRLKMDRCDVIEGAYPQCRGFIPLLLQSGSGEGNGAHLVAVEPKTGAVKHIQYYPREQYPGWGDIKSNWESSIAAVFNTRATLCDIIDLSDGKLVRPVPLEQGEFVYGFDSQMGLIFISADSAICRIPHPYDKPREKIWSLVREAE